MTKQVWTSLGHRWIRHRERVRGRRMRRRGRGKRGRRTRRGERRRRGRRRTCTSTL